MHLETIMVTRLLVAGLFGGLIGLEREFRSKEAGLRTHFVVCLGSALFMLVSQYGFVDSISELAKLYGPNVDIRTDTSRVAAQIVSGIGFIGAGTIVLHKKFVVGLTTAAGLWTTAAIGMAIGGGMYLIGFLSTLLTLAGFEMLRHISHRIGHLKREMRVVFFADTEQTAKNVATGICSGDMTLFAYSSFHQENRIKVKMTMGVPEHAADVRSILDYLQNTPGVEAESVE